MGTGHQQLGVQAVQEELQRSQSLLAIDDRSDRQLAHRMRQLLDDYRAEEVGLRLLLRARHAAFGDADDVLPERLPLGCLIPDVSPLEEGHHQPLWHPEHGVWSRNLGLHLCSSCQLSSVKSPHVQSETARPRNSRQPA